MTEININMLDKKKSNETSEKISLKKEIKETIKQNMETTPIHGLPFIVNSKSWYMKLFWILFFVGFAAFGSWLIIKAFSDYLEYPVVSEVKENIESHPEFPAV